MKKIVFVTLAVFLATIVLMYLQAAGYVDRGKFPAGWSKDYTTTKHRRERETDEATTQTIDNSRKHIAFLKLHKTASSTAQNIFLRFGDTYNLTFILPHVKGESGWPNVISYNNTVTDDNIVPPPPGKKFDLLCCHVLYNRKEFDARLPPDTKFIAIVREPVSRFQSALKYFRTRYVAKIPAQQKISAYLDNPLKYEPTDPKQSQLNNRMAVELGFPTNLFPGKPKSNSTQDINRYLSALENEFDLIMITERFDESVVYMRRALCWTTKDILYIDQNKSQDPGKQKPWYILSEKDKEALRNSEYLRLDFALYQFAVRRFDNQIKSEGEDFQKELALFRQIRQRTVVFCGEKSSNNSLLVNGSKWSKSFTVTKNDCQNFVKHEKDYIHKARMKLYGTVHN